MFSINKFFRKMVFVFIIFSLTLVNNSFAQKDIIININSIEKSFSSKPVIVNNRTMFPLRDICEYLGAKVDYDSANRAVKISKGNTNSVLHLDTKSVTTNGDTIEYDVYPRIIKGTTYVPAVIMGDITDSTVIWSNKKKTVLIINEDITKNISSLSKNKQEFIKKAIQIDNAYAKSNIQNHSLSTADYVQGNGAFEEKWEDLIEQINEKLNMQKGIDVSTMILEFSSAKDKRVDNSGLEMEGGTGQVIAQSFASLYATRERAYELILLYLE